MKVTKAKLSAVTTALVLTVIGCAKPGNDPAMMSGSADPSAALAIITTQPRADHAAVAALVAGSARTGEQLEIVSSSGMCSAQALPRLLPSSPARPRRSHFRPTRPSSRSSPTIGGRSVQREAHRRPPDPGAPAGQPFFRLGGRHDGRDDAVRERDRIRSGTWHLGGGHLHRQLPAGRTEARPPPRAGHLRRLRRPGPPSSGEPHRDHCHPRGLSRRHARAGRVAGSPAAGRCGSRDRAGARRS